MRGRASRPRMGGPFAARRRHRAWRGTRAATLWRRIRGRIRLRLRIRRHRAEGTALLRTLKQTDWGRTVGARSG